MTEYRLFEGDVPHVSTAEFHADRERAPHLEQPWHQPRLSAAASFVLDFGSRHMDEYPARPRLSVSDLGCGDGGLLSVLRGSPDLGAVWGYDFAPANRAGWEERGVKAQPYDVFGADWDRVVLGDIVVMTEVLEHLADPHGALLRLAERRAVRLVCSSPWNETPADHSPEHAWAWDTAGYRAMLEGAGWVIREQRQVGLFQVVQATANGKAL